MDCCHLRGPRQRCFWPRPSQLKVWVAAGFLSMQMKVMGPFLVVVPLSTVPNWIKEFNKWLPQANTVVYVGDSKSREVMPPSAVAAVQGSVRHSGQPRPVAEQGFIWTRAHVHSNECIPGL